MPHLWLKYTVNLLLHVYWKHLTFELYQQIQYNSWLPSVCITRARDIELVNEIEKDVPRFQFFIVHAIPLSTKHF